MSLQKLFPSHWSLCQRCFAGMSMLRLINPRVHHRCHEQQAQVASLSCLHHTSLTMSLPFNKVCYVTLICNISCMYQPTRPVLSCFLSFSLEQPYKCCCSYLKHPLQSNMDDCGVFAIMLMSQLGAAANLEFVEQQHMQEWRQHLASCLLQRKPPGIINSALGTSNPSGIFGLIS